MEFERECFDDVIGGVGGVEEDGGVGFGNGGGVFGFGEVIGGFDEVTASLVFVTVAVGVVLCDEFLGDVVGVKVCEDAYQED